MSPDWAQLNYTGKVKNSDRSENHPCTRGAIPVKRGLSFCGWGLHEFQCWFSSFFLRVFWFKECICTELLLQLSDPNFSFLCCLRLITASVGGTEDCCQWDLGLASVAKTMSSLALFRCFLLPLWYESQRWLWHMTQTSGSVSSCSRGFGNKEVADLE